MHQPLQEVVVKAVKVNASLSLAGPRMTGVALLRLDDEGRTQHTSHGAFPSRQMAWLAADFMVDRLNRVIQSQGFVAQDDVDRVFALADAFVRAPRREFG